MEKASKKLPVLKAKKRIASPLEKVVAKPEVKKEIPALKVQPLKKEIALKDENIVSHQEELERIEREYQQELKEEVVAEVDNDEFNASKENKIK